MGLRYSKSFMGYICSLDDVNVHLYNISYLIWRCKCFIRFSPTKTWARWRSVCLLETNYCTRNYWSTRCTHTCFYSANNILIFSFGYADFFLFVEILTWLSSLWPLTPAGDPHPWRAAWSAGRSSDWSDEGVRWRGWHHRWSCAHDSSGGFWSGCGDNIHNTAVDHSLLTAPPAG